LHTFSTCSDRQVMENLLSSINFFQSVAQLLTYCIHQWRCTVYIAKSIQDIIGYSTTLIGDLLNSSTTQRETSLNSNLNPISLYVTTIQYIYVYFIIKIIYCYIVVSKSCMHVSPINKAKFINSWDHWNLYCSCAYVPRVVEYDLACKKLSTKIYYIITIHSTVKYAMYKDEELWLDLHFDGTHE